MLANFERSESNPSSSKKKDNHALQIMNTQDTLIADINNAKILETPILEKSLRIKKISAPKDAAVTQSPTTTTVKLSIAVIKKTSDTSMTIIIVVAVIVPILATGIVAFLVWFFCRHRRKAAIFSRQMDEMDAHRKIRLAAHTTRTNAITPASTVGPPSNKSSYRIRNNSSFAQPQPSFDRQISTAPGDLQSIMA